MRVNQSGNNPVQNTEAHAAKRGGRAGKAQDARESSDASESSEVKGDPNALAARTSSDVKADLSARGKEFARAKAAASGAPDVREEKIAELKRRIAAGKYNVDSDAVADKMVNEHLSMSGLS